MPTNQGADAIEPEPNPKTRAKAFAILFGSFATVVSIVIWFTSEHAEISDYVFVFGFPPLFAVLAYFIGLHVSDKAIG